MHPGRSGSRPALPFRSPSALARFMGSALGLAPMLAADEPNIEHPTSNAERRTPKSTRKLPSMFGVRCWAFGVRLRPVHGKRWRAGRGGTVSPLTPALSPVRGEGGRRCPRLVCSLHSMRSLPVRARRRPTQLLQARRPRGALPLSPQRGEGGVRGEAPPKTPRIATRAHLPIPVRASAVHGKRPVPF